jgi:hypothetical protein
MNQRSLAMIVLVVACGGGKPAATPTNPPPAAAPVLAITDLKFFEGDKMGMELHEDGRLELVVAGAGAQPTKQVIATLEADGSMTAKDGKVAHFHPDGTLEGPDGKLAPLKFDGDALVVDGKRVTIDDKGAISIDSTASPLRIEGAHDRNARRTALLLSALILGGQAEPSTPAP